MAQILQVAYENVDLFCILIEILSQSVRPLLTDLCLDEIDNALNSVKSHSLTENCHLKIKVYMVTLKILPVNSLPFMEGNNLKYIGIFNILSVTLL